MNIGIIGLGTMGMAITRRLIEHTHHSIWGYDVMEAPRQALRQMNCSIAASPEDLLRSCSVVFFSLPTNELVAAYFKQAIEICAPGTIVADLSSSLPEIIRAAEPAANAKDISLLDCPVSGGPQGAEKGTLSVMCGGSAAALESVRPVIQSFAGTVTRVGGLGCGYVAKLANNMIVGAEIVAIAEAMAFAQRGGIEPQLFFDAVRGGAAGGPVLELKGAQMLHPDQAVTSRLNIHLKDQHNALACGARLSAFMPMCTAATDCMDQMEKRGYGSRDAACVIDLFEPLSGGGTDKIQ